MTTITTTTPIAASPIAEGYARPPLTVSQIGLWRPARRSCGCSAPWQDRYALSSSQDVCGGPSPGVYQYECALAWLLHLER
jgi:hypothetical protein